MDKKLFSVALDSETYEKLGKFAKEIGLTRSGLVRMLIMNYISDMEKK